MRPCEQAPSSGAGTDATYLAKERGRPRTGRFDSGAGRAVCSILRHHMVYLAPTAPVLRCRLCGRAWNSLAEVRP